MRRGRSDIKPNDSIDFRIRIVRRGKLISNPMVPLILELYEQGGKGDIKTNSAIDFGIEGARW